MASIITATTTSGLTQSADNSGVLQLASGAGNLVTVPSVTGTMLTTATTGVCRAWGQCAFNSGGNLSLTSSYNISSLTRNSSGNYTFNYTTNLSSANYSVVGTANNGSGVNSAILNPTGRSTSSVTLNTGYVSATNGTLSQYDYGIDFAVFGA